MADFYADLARMVEDLLLQSPSGGLGQTGIQYAREQDDVYLDPLKPPPASNLKVLIPLKAVAFGVSAKLIGTEVAPGVVIKAGDITITTAVFDIGTLLPSDGFLLGTDFWPIKNFTRIPAVGTATAFVFLVGR